MREIKFRAWIKSGFDKDIEPFMANVSVIRFEGGNIETDEDDNLWDLENDVILMQFTGLKDKNGKEIYEGDILQWCDTTNVKNKWVVEQYSGGWGPFIPDMTTDKSFRYEVIGNIYENRELLK